MAHHLHALMTLALLPPGASGMGLRAAHEPNADAARMPRQRLAGGGQMPMSGIGLSAVKGTRAHDATLEFLRAGGRLLDTAEHYGNHGQVGAAIREAIKDHGVRREDVFLTTKLPQTLFERGNATRWVKTMLHDLGVDYVDLVLLHTGGSPFKSPEQLGITGCKTWSQCRRQAWLALSDARDAGQIRAVGVSNFGPRQMRELIDLKRAPIAMNQLEYNPWVPKPWRLAVDFCRKNGVGVTAFNSIGGGLRKGKKFLQDDRVRLISKAHDKTPQQVLLRWATQHDVHVIAGTSNPAHMRDNLAIFDFELTAEEMASLDSVPKAEWAARVKNQKVHTPDLIP
mmetsp:Transcript_179/g.568  ORF Transcript_179/g.568 Transcript_179/m.568 type:complete len:340 (-) Transcript_179:142-1161(-)